MGGVRGGREGEGKIPREGGAGGQGRAREIRNVGEGGAGGEGEKVWDLVGWWRAGDDCVGIGGREGAHCGWELGGGYGRGGGRRKDGECMYVYVGSGNMFGGVEEREKDTYVNDCLGLDCKVVGV